MLNVQTQVTEKIQDQLRNGICDFKVQIQEIYATIHDLKGGTYDGLMGTVSNHFMYASYRFIMLLLVCNAMTIHDHTPDTLLEFVLVSIPKENRASVRNGDNYRGIALSCALCQIIDIWIMKKYGDVLRSCDLQFAFKEGHSRVMCTAMLEQTISHYMKHNSDVYVCILDSSKAFDRVEYANLPIAARYVTACLNY